MTASRSKRNDLITTQPDGARTRTYTTARGVVVTISPNPPLSQAALKTALELEWLDAGRSLPEKPTFQIPAAGGKVLETHEHDEETIKDDPEAAQAWAHWKAESAAFQEQLRDRQMRVFILDCLEFDIPPEWEARARAAKIKVPADPDERKLFFAQTRVLGDAQDILQTMKIAAELAGVSEKQLAAFRDSFRRPVAGANGHDARADAPGEGPVERE